MNPTRVPYPNEPVPFGRRIYIRPEKQQTLIQSGDDAKVVRGYVLATGPEVTKVRPGETLIFTAWGVDEVEINGEHYYFLLESDEFILARIPVPSGMVAQVQTVKADATS